MKISQIFQKCRNFTTRKKRETLKSGKIQILGFKRHLSTSSSNEEPLKELINYLDNLKNYEKSGVPKGAGIDSDTTGFDMGRMNRLMEGLGNPQSKFKGKGSTAMFLSNILRKEGYSVGCYTSPHLWSIRERILLGKQGKPVSAEALNRLFSGVKNILDRSIEMENGSISHFEVLTAVTFSLFAQENVDIAVVEAGLGGARDATNVFSSSDLIASVITTIGEEHLAALGGSLESIALAKSGIMKHACPVVLGGPFEPRIERILHDRAVLMNSPIISAYSLGNKSTIKGVKVNNGRPYQSCDILLDFQKDPKSFLELFDVRLSMLGRHQLQNAVTASCAALAFRDQGWKVADESIRIGLESTYLPGRSQFLTPEEVSEIGLDGATVLVDGAHTKESARALVDTIQLTYPDAALAFVVAMASDKDHPAFAKELLSGRNTIEAVVFTEISIAGERSRMTAASSLKNAWTRAATELGNSFSDGSSEKFGSSYDQGQQKPELVVLGSVKDSMKVADEILRLRSKGRSNLIVVTGSLHIVSAVLTSLQRSE